MTHSLRTIGYGNVFWAIFLGIFLICSHVTAQAAEIRLKSMPVQVTQPLVTLADVADVVPMNNESVEALRRQVLFPAPASGTTRTLDQWQLRNILSQLGVTSIHHLISGAESVTILGASPNIRAASPNEGFVIQASAVQSNVIQASHLAPVGIGMNASAPPAGLTEDMARRLEGQIAQALNMYLNITNRLERTWDVSLNLTPEQVKGFMSNGQIAEITGGQIPFTGIQRFHIRMENNVTISVDAVVELPTKMVVVTRTLPKGQIISASDVMLQRTDRVRGEEFFVDINSVIGKETTRVIRNFEPVTQSNIRKPLLVRRGEIVTVRVVNNGIAVSTEATAMQDGVEGDTITVAKLDLTPRRGRREAPETYLARVSAPKTVEVFAR